MDNAKNPFTYRPPENQDFSTTSKDEVKLFSSIFQRVDKENSKSDDDVPSVRPLPFSFGRPRASDVEVYPGRFQHSDNAVSSSPRSDNTSLFFKPAQTSAATATQSPLFHKPSQATPATFHIPGTSEQSPVKRVEGLKPIKPSAIALNREPKMAMFTILFKKDDNRAVNEAVIEERTMETSIKGKKQQNAKKRIPEASSGKLMTQKSPIMKHKTVEAPPRIFNTNPPIGLDPTHTCFACERPFYDFHQLQQPLKLSKPGSAQWPPAASFTDYIRALITLLVIIFVLTYSDKARYANDVVVKKLQDISACTLNSTGAFPMLARKWYMEGKGLFAMLWLKLLKVIGM